LRVVVVSYDFNLSRLVLHIGPHQAVASLELKAVASSFRSKRFFTGHRFGSTLGS
jgi:hypothetical protein